ncbi:MAG: hypothetical protein CML66_29925 [Rhodobacteraceae bacterium]|nr:hypothetical protein [Paracoccaceae bacterium]MAY47199.1 hypothetical protein [Paracoccaceae bacterium]|tara:strand:- start:1285 stop:1872 length:588 start_codon:yes stop_codon:yes gene_type:complete
MSSPSASSRKIIQIGFNKCATRSISFFLKRHGLTTADWMHGDLAKNIRESVETGEVPLAAWPDVQVFSDMEYVHARHMAEGYRYFRELHAAYPDALFILNTRNVEGWIRSRHKHGDGAYTSSYRRYYGYKSDAEVWDRWRLEWFRHHLAVLEYFSGPLREQLFVWDIEAPDWAELEARLGFPVDANKWSVRGKTE